MSIRPQMYALLEGRKPADLRDIEAAKAKLEKAKKRPGLPKRIWDKMNAAIDLLGQVADDMARDLGL
jgi:hypothetical protein